MFPGIRRGDCVCRMFAMRCANEHRVYIVSVHQAFDVLIAFHPIIGGQLLGTAATCNSDQPSARQILCNCFRVRPAHETGANDSQSDFVHSLSAAMCSTALPRSPSRDAAFVRTLATLFSDSG